MSTSGGRYIGMWLTTGVRRRGLLLTVAILVSVGGFVVNTAPVAARTCSTPGAWNRPKKYSVDMGYLRQQRVRWALGGLQNTLTLRGKMSAEELYHAAITHRFTRATKRAVRDLQNDPGSIAKVTGEIGPNTSRWLFQPYVLFYESLMGAPRHLLHGVVGIEGDYDPAAVGCNDPNDRGILQYNSVAHPDVSDAEAFGDPLGMIERAAREMKARYDSYTGSYYAGLTNTERWNAAAAGHNTPVGGRNWAHCMAANITLLGCTRAGVQAWDYFTDSPGRDSGVEAYAANFPY